MQTSPTITKAEIAEHFVTVDQLHDDLVNMVHDYYTQPHNHRVAIIEQTEQMQSWIESKL